MKLIYCKECRDVVKMRYEDRTCFCGKSKGKYIDNLYAQYSGPCIPVGIHNSEFVEALRNQPEDGPGYEFCAFVIEKECPTFKKLDEKDNANNS